MFEREWFNVREPVHQLDRREIPDPTADQHWWVVAVDDWVLPAAIKVWMTGTDAARVAPHRFQEFVVDELRQKVADYDQPERQVKALRALSPLQLRPVG